MVHEKVKTVVVAFDIDANKDTAAFVQWLIGRVQDGRALDAVITNKSMIQKALDNQAEVI